MLTKAERIKNNFEDVALHESAHALMLFCSGIGSVQISVYRENQGYSGDVQFNIRPYYRVDDVAVMLAGPMSEWMYRAPNKYSDKTLRLFVLETKYPKGRDGITSDLEYIHQNYTIQEIEAGVKLCAKRMRKFWKDILRIKKELSTQYKMNIKHVSIQLDCSVAGVKVSKPTTMSSRAKIVLGKDFKSNLTMPKTGATFSTRV